MMERALAGVPRERFAGAILITDGQVHDTTEAATMTARAGPVHVLLVGRPNEQDRRLIVEQAPSFGIVGEPLTLRLRVDDGAATAGALGATMLVPAPWRAAFGQAKPYKIGALQPLSGAAAAGGKTALVGVQMAADRMNKSGGINGRPVEIVAVDPVSGTVAETVKVAVKLAAAR